MSRIRGRGNRSTELVLATEFRRQRITGWRRHVRLRPELAPRDQKSNASRGRISVSPDFVFRYARLAVFVDGCFWHACPTHATQPVANAEFWRRKLARNVQRDQLATRALKNAGWNVVRVWEHDMARASLVAARVKRRLRLRSDSVAMRDTAGRSRKRGLIAPNTDRER